MNVLTRPVLMEVPGIPPVPDHGIVGGVPLGD
jgi:hypothetical protein